MELFDRFTAEFEPQNMDDLRFEALSWVGGVCEWQVAWIIESGTYKGEFACVPFIQLEHPEITPPFCWAPLCDLKVLQVF